MFCKISENWVSFYLNNIVTIRNNDWKNLEKFFVIPEPIRAIDYERVKLKDKKLIPLEIELNIDKTPVKIEKTKLLSITNVKTNKSVKLINS